MSQLSVTLLSLFLGITFTFILVILVLSQEFPCLFNHSFANVNYAYCNVCGQPLSSICPNGHRVDGDFCHICGETPVK